ncbi:DUF401 family protein [Gudongella sp. DL1XJH-153]|uniref:DUF401 family protein n=1 Tax=Gudongella sp. DL1XJH-153 TaxID=3409804 RepID=UPI003BB60758
MDIIKLIAVFAVIVVVMRMNKPLYISVTVGSISTVLLYGISFSDLIQALRIGIIGGDTIMLVLAFYSITFLQRMLEKRGHLIQAEKALTNIFNSRRINAMIAPFIIGLLPSAGAVLIASPIVDTAAGSDLTQEEKTFVTSFYRHISEAFLPTYASIILAVNLSGLEMTSFILGMLPMIVVLFLLGYIFYVRKIPKVEESLEGIIKTHEIKRLFEALWTIMLSITIILVLGTPVHLSVIPVIILSYFINRFRYKEVRSMFYTAFETKLILTTVVIMVFKELLTATGVIERLPDYFSAMAVPPVVIFGLIFFFGTLVAGSKAMIALALPIAFATIPGGGISLLVFLMSINYIAMQISPTHICLAIITEEHGTSFISLVKKTMPVLVSFVVIASAYSYLLYNIL